MSAASLSDSSLKSHTYGTLPDASLKHQHRKCGAEHRTSSSVVRALQITLIVGAIMALTTVARRYDSSKANFDVVEPAVVETVDAPVVNATAPPGTVFRPSDLLATDSTTALYNSLHSISSSDGFLFGHQNDEWKGQNFRDPTGENHLSDVNIATNGTEWPAVFGFNIWNIFNDSSFTLQHFVKSAYKRGGVVEVEWEADNPITGEDARDCTGNPMNHILPDGSANKNWTRALDRIVEEILTYRVEDVAIPVIIRLFHENTGGWYWWGTSCVNSTQYVTAFRYTIDYLRSKGLHNLLVVYAPSKPSTHMPTVFEDLYPGNEVIDIIAFDRYGNTEYAQNIQDDAAVVVPFAEKNFKVPALAETGFLKGTNNIGNDYLKSDTAWWTDTFLKPIVNNPNASRISYFITWTDYSADCYWIPLRGDATYDSFIHMSKSENVLFLNDKAWTDLPYAHEVQLAREKYLWDRRKLYEPKQGPNSYNRGAKRCVLSNGTKGESWENGTLVYTDGSGVVP